MESVESLVSDNSLVQTCMSVCVCLPVCLRVYGVVMFSVACHRALLYLFVIFFWGGVEGDGSMS